MTQETYTVLVLSTGLLTVADQFTLNALVEENMVMRRDTGYFVKLYEEEEYNQASYGILSKAVRTIILESHKLGFRMIEFDRDG